MIRLQLPYRPVVGKSSQICGICTLRLMRPSLAKNTTRTKIGLSRPPTHALASRDLSPHPLPLARLVCRSLCSSSRNSGYDQSQSFRSRGAGGSNGAGDEAHVLGPLDRIVAPVLQIKGLILSQGGIPTEEAVLSALRTCEKAAGLLKNVAGPFLQRTLDAQPGTSASEALLSLDGSADDGCSPSSSSPNPGDSDKSVASGPRATGQSQPPSESASGPGRGRVHPAIHVHKRARDTILETAYSIVVHPSVSITPKILEQYVRVQAQLGSAETLPHVLALYMSKPGFGHAKVGESVQHAKKDRFSLGRAVDARVAEAALDVAIEARNLDAAVGIVENTYGSQAFVRSKLVKTALIPVSGLVGVPCVIYALASGMSRFQNTMEGSTATVIAFAAILTYAGSVGLLGTMATTTANDQMKRVTWSRGTSLYQRWMGEEQRAALDRVACSFGFSEPMRWGEEEGSDFAALREYILRRGMVLDSLELRTDI